MSRSTVGYNLLVEGGTTYSLAVIYSDSAGNPIDLTGYLAEFQVRQKVGSATLIDLSNGTGLTVGTTDGRIDLQIPAFSTESMSGNYLYAMDITSPGGIVTRLLRGEMFVSADLTT